jgi:hypothetical protein
LSLYGMVNSNILLDRIYRITWIFVPFRLSACTVQAGMKDTNPIEWLLFSLEADQLSQGPPESEKKHVNPVNPVGLKFFICLK